MKGWLTSYSTFILGISKSLQSVQLRSHWLWDIQKIFWNSSMILEADMWIVVCFKCFIASIEINIGYILLICYWLPSAIFVAPHWYPWGLMLSPPTAHHASYILSHISIEIQTQTKQFYDHKLKVKCQKNTNLWYI